MSRNDRPCETTAALASSERPTRERRWVAALAVTAILTIHVIGRVGSFCSPVHADSYAYSVIGYRIAHGGVFYSQNLCDVKPPGLYHLYALAYLFLPSGRASMIPLDSVVGLLGYWAMFRLSAEMFGRRIGWVVTVSGVLLINAWPVLDFGTEGFGLAESFMVFPALMAVRQYRHGLMRPGLAPLFWCGVWLGVEASIKQTALPLVLAIAVHFSVRELTGRRDLRRWLCGSALMIAGGLAAATPWFVMFWVQGTWSRVIEALGPSALDRLSQFTAWPDQWGNVMPAWMMLVWGAMGLLWWLEARFHKSEVHSVARGALDASEVGFLVMWFVFECAMLIKLPFRSFHYYVVTSLPLILLAGIFWTRVASLNVRLRADAAFACLSTAAVLSLSFGRMTVDALVPIAIARYRAYDADVDNAFFQSMADREIIDFYRPPPPESPRAIP